MFSKLFNKIKSKNTDKYKEKDKRSKSQRESTKHHQSFGATTRWETDSSASDNENNQDQNRSNEHSIVYPLLMKFLYVVFDTYEQVPMILSGLNFNTPF